MLCSMKAPLGGRSATLQPVPLRGAGRRVVIKHILASLTRRVMDEGETARQQHKAFDHRARTCHDASILLALVSFSLPASLCTPSLLYSSPFSSTHFSSYYPTSSELFSSLLPVYCSSPLLFSSLFLYHFEHVFCFEVTFSPPSLPPSLSVRILSRLHFFPSLHPSHRQPFPLPTPPHRYRSARSRLPHRP